MSCVFVARIIPVVRVKSKIKTRTGKLFVSIVQYIPAILESRSDIVYLYQVPGATAVYLGMQS